MSVKVTYILADYNKVIIAFHAISTKATSVNLTNYAYFNLNGETS
ncbi:aldose epimerase family protein [Gilliamella apicola]